MITNRGDTLNHMRLSNKAVRHAVEAENDGISVLSERIKLLGEETLCEDVGETKFNEWMRLAKLREELGEEQFKMVRFCALTAMAFDNPDQYQATCLAPIRPTLHLEGPAAFIAPA
jgi:hypothetical protein